MIRLVSSCTGVPQDLFPSPIENFFMTRVVFWGFMILSAKKLSETVAFLSFGSQRGGKKRGRS